MRPDLDAGLVIVDCVAGLPVTIAEAVAGVEAWGLGGPWLGRGCADIAVRAGNTESPAPRRFRGPSRRRRLGGRIHGASSVGANHA